MTTFTRGPQLAVATLLAVLASTAAHALTDPMRPLAAATAVPAGTLAANPTAASVPAQATLASDRLVAIRRDGDGRLQALIGEQWLGVGDRVGGRAGKATLRGLSETSATLVLGRQQLVLHVLPPLLASRETAPTAERRHGPTPLASAQRSRPSPPSRSKPTP